MRNCAEVQKLKNKKKIKKLIPSLVAGFWISQKCSQLLLLVASYASKTFREHSSTIFWVILFNIQKINVGKAENWSCNKISSKKTNGFVRETLCLAYKVSWKLVHDFWMIVLTENKQRNKPKCENITSFSRGKRRQDYRCNLDGRKYRSQGCPLSSKCVLISIGVTMVPTQMT